MLAATAAAAQTSALPAPVATPAFPVKRAAWAAVAGAIAGAVIGTRAISFANVPGPRAGHEFRSALVYGAIGGVGASALSVRLSPAAHTPEPHRFLLDRWNTPLLTGMAAVHILDFASTRYFRNRGKSEWLLTNGVVDNRAAFALTEASALGAGVGLIYLLHRSGHHRIERWAAAGYIVLGVASAIANFRYPSTGHGLY
ncbi:MAG: hypothetical protein ACRD1A_08280 [Terriglobales bacterium]